jgi:hypothetical protein
MNHCMSLSHAESLAECKASAQDVDMHFGSPGSPGITSGRVRAALEFTFLNSAVDANGKLPHLVQ